MKILIINCITDNKTFWKTVKPFFFDKTSPVTSIMLKDKDAIILKDKDAIMLKDKDAIMLKDKDAIMLKDKDAIMLKDKDAIICDDKKCAEILNSYFANLVKNLDIKHNLRTLDVPRVINNDVDNAILKYRAHPNIIKIKTHH